MSAAKQARTKAHAAALAAKAVKTAAKPVTSAVITELEASGPAWQNKIESVVTDVLPNEIRCCARTFSLRVAAVPMTS
jgi:hypothetical protein